MFPFGRNRDKNRNFSCNTFPKIPLIMPEGNLSQGLPLSPGVIKAGRLSGNCKNKNS